LSNYAKGDPQDTAILIDFSDLEAGFTLPGEAVWAGDIGRLFVLLVPPGRRRSRCARRGLGGAERTRLRWAGLDAGYRRRAGAVARHRHRNRL
jgi:hypothetical protein